MSWSLPVPPTARDEFDQAVDAAETSPPGPLADEPAGQVEIARRTLKLLAAETLGDENTFVQGSASGHACSEGTGGGSNPYDSISLSVFGVPAPVMAGSDASPAETAG